MNPHSKTIFSIQVSIYAGRCYCVEQNWRDVKNVFLMECRFGVVNFVMLFKVSSEVIFLWYVFQIEIDDAIDFVKANFELLCGHYRQRF